MQTASQTLAQFAANLTYDDIPVAAVQRTKDCIINAVGAAVFGVPFAWSRMAIDYAERYGAGGPCSIIGYSGPRVQAPFAAFANGALVHAFEQDSVGGYTEKGVAIPAHPGAILVPALLAACEETGVDGKTAIVAFVAASEVMFRISLSTHHSAERRGFHEPGLIGPYCAAIAAGIVYGLNAEELANALGIAGSLSAGLLAFSKSESGGMVKRLHLGRAAEAGILAARLAGSGYAGPERIFEGRYGFHDAYCTDPDGDVLTAALNERWETLRICIKRYPCHTSTHVAVQLLREQMAEHRFNGDDVESIVVHGGPSLLSHHDIKEPRDLMKAQYSAPYSLAICLYRDPDDPSSFNDSALSCPSIKAAALKIEMRTHIAGSPEIGSTRVTVRLKNGRVVERSGRTFRGSSSDPFTQDELRAKFLMMTRSMDQTVALELFERLQSLEERPNFSL